MKATQQTNYSLVFTHAFILLMTVLVLISFPFVRQVLEQLNLFLGDLLSDFQNEISRNYGR